MDDRADKRVAISLLMASGGKRYWEFTIKQRLARMKAMIEWLKSRVSYF